MNARQAKSLESKCSRCGIKSGTRIVRRRYNPAVWSEDVSLHFKNAIEWRKPRHNWVLSNGMCQWCSHPKRPWNQEVHP